MLTVTDSERGARDAANRLLDRFCVSRPSDIRLEDIAWRLGVVVRDGPLPGADGRLLCQGDFGLVRVRSSIQYGGQKRFAVAHELGHWQMHRGRKAEWVCTEADMRDYAKKDMEKEANCFASEFLMPHELFRPKAAACLPSVASIIRLAEEFGTSLSATGIRLHQTTDCDALMIASKGGRQKWYARSVCCTLPNVVLKTTVGPEAVANRCRFSDPVEPIGPYEVPASAWFPYASGSVLEEAVMLMPDGLTLSLLRPA